MDLSATVDLVGKMAVDAMRPKKLDIRDPRAERYLNPRTMEVVDVKLPPAARRHQVTSIDDFIAAANAAKDGFWGGAQNPIIWFSSDELVLVIDDAERHDLITTKLVHSPYWLTLRQYDVKDGTAVKRLAQKPLLELLKLTLRGCVADGQVLIDAVSAIRFRKIDGGGTNITRGKESMDADIAAEVSGWANVPEEWQVSFPVYWNEGERQNLLTVLCYVDVDLDSQQFIFRPMPGEMDLALESAKAKIRERLIEGLDEEFPIYYGTL